MTIDDYEEADLITKYPGKVVKFTMDNIWKSKKCEHCSAYLFKHEPNGFCCSGGKVKIPLPNPPDVLKDLLKNNINKTT